MKATTPMLAMLTFIEFQDFSNSTNWSSDSDGSGPPFLL